MEPVITVLWFGRSIEDRSGNLYLTDPGEKMLTSWTAAAVEAGETKILIDTGVHDVAWAQWYSTCMQDPSETLEGALGLVGWRPEEVDIVINTHLHFDHCGLNSRFRRARFVVQRAEWEAAQRPIKTQREIYLPELFDERAVYPASWVFVSGDYEVAPGVSVFSTPGHSAGHQSVLIETAAGKVVYSGDAVNLLENLTRDIVPGILIDVHQCLDSMDRIRQSGNYVIPSHDPIVRPGQNSSFPAMPQKPD